MVLNTRGLQSISAAMMQYEHLLLIGDYMRFGNFFLFRVCTVVFWWAYKIQLPKVINNFFSKLVCLYNLLLIFTDTSFYMYMNCRFTERKKNIKAVNISLFAVPGLIVKKKFCSLFYNPNRCAWIEIYNEKYQ